MSNSGRSNTGRFSLTFAEPVTNEIVREAEQLDCHQPSRTDIVQDLMLGHVGVLGSDDPSESCHSVTAAYQLASHPAVPAGLPARVIRKVVSAAARELSGSSVRSTRIWASPRDPPEAEPFCRLLNNPPAGKV